MLAAGGQADSETKPAPAGAAALVDMVRLVRGIGIRSAASCAPCGCGMEEMEEVDDDDEDEDSDDVVVDEVDCCC